MNPPGDDIVEMTSAEFIAAAEGELGEMGMTLDQLRHEADERSFSSERARRIWFAVSPLA